MADEDYNLDLAASTESRYLFRPRYAILGGAKRKQKSRWRRNFGFMVGVIVG